MRTTLTPAQKEAIQEAHYSHANNKSQSQKAAETETGTDFFPTASDEVLTELRANSEGSTISLCPEGNRRNQTAEFNLLLYMEAELHSAHSWLYS